MEHTTDIDALEAEIAALVADDAAQSARIDALLASTGSVRAQLGDLRFRIEMESRELDVIERQQRRISRALDALDLDP